MNFAIVQLFIFQLILPAFFIFTLWKSKYVSKLEWLIQALLAIMYTIWSIFLGKWDWLSYYFIFVWFLLVVFTSFRFWSDADELPFLIQASATHNVSLAR